MTKIRRTLHYRNIGMSVLKCEHRKLHRVRHGYSPKTFVEQKIEVAEMTKGQGTRVAMMQIANHMVEETERQVWKVAM